MEKKSCVLSEKERVLLIEMLNQGKHSKSLVDMMKEGIKLLEEFHEHTTIAIRIDRAVRSLHSTPLSRRERKRS